MDGKNLIGVHIRHGNGEGKYSGAFREREITGFSLFINSIAVKIRRYTSNRFGDNYIIFLCTDSNDVVNSMRPLFESLVSRRIWRQESVAGMEKSAAIFLDHEETAQF